MLEQQLEAGRLYAKLRQYNYRLDYAIEGIETMLDIAPNSYASISFGKQSICMAHLLYQFEPTMPMYFLASSETWNLHNYIEIIDGFMRHTPINLTIVQTNRWGISLSVPISEMKKRQPSIKWIIRGWNETPETWKLARDAGDKDIQEMCNLQDWHGLFMGLVKEESRGRRITMSLRWKGQPHRTIFKYKTRQYRCCPLAEWGNNDVAAYVGENDIKLLDEYEQFGLEARTTARITKMMAGESGMAYLKRKNISTFNLITATFSELRSYT